MNSEGRWKRRPDLGFTIIEMIMVVAIVAIMTSIAAPVFNPGRWRADQAAQELAATLGATQRLAVLRQHDVSVTFHLDDRVLRIHRDADNDGTVDAGEDVQVFQLPETIGFGVGFAPTLPGDGASADVTFAQFGGHPRLIFHRNGSASEAGRIYLRPIEGSMSTDAEATRALRIERSTGAVSCFSYRTGQWALC